MKNKHWNERKSNKIIKIEDVEKVTFVVQSGDQLQYFEMSHILSKSK